MIDIPTLLMVMLIISHTLAIAYLKKQRSKLDVTNTDGQATAKRINFVITILFIEIPFLTALIWLVVKPAMMASGN